MPEYKCECCRFKTKIKTQYVEHTQTKKHLKLFEEHEGSRVELLDKIIQLEKIIEELKEENEKLKKNTQSESVKLPNIDDFIDDLFVGLFDTTQYTKTDGLTKRIDWEAFILDNISPEIKNRMSIEDAVYEELKEAYKEDCVASIFNSFKKKIPREIIKIGDLSRNKFYIRNENRWLNKAESEEKIMEFVKYLQEQLTQFHNIWTNCCEVEPDLYSTRNEKVCGGNDEHQKVLKKILEWYEDPPQFKSGVMLPNPQLHEDTQPLI
jgi:hypothetical protein